MILEEVIETLPRQNRAGSRMVKTIHGVRVIEQDPRFELEMAEQLGRGAVVTKDVPEFSSVGGAAARGIGRRKKRDVERIQATSRP